IFDFDKEGETLFIAMEYVEGRDLKRVMEASKKAEMRLSVPQIVSIMVETCKGLHYAHSKKRRGEPLNIIHRDVSPHNVMMSFDGEVKVMDFGIAKAAARSTKTKAGTVKGKCAYMSPEQASGKELDPRSDMFSVGVILWELLAGERLFVGDSDFETLSKVLKMDAPAPSDKNPNVPLELDEIVLQCLQKKRDDRQADCRVLAKQLEQWLYSNVSAFDDSGLDHFLHTLFADDIAALRELQTGDRRDQYLEASAQVRAQRHGSSSSVTRQSMESSSSVDAAPISEAPTLALDAAAAKAAIDAAARLHGESTVAFDPSSLSATGIARPTATDTTRKSRTPLMVGIAAVILALGGVGLWLTGNDAPPEASKLQAQSQAHGAQQTTAAANTAFQASTDNVTLDKPTRARSPNSEKAEKNNHGDNAQIEANGLDTPSGNEEAVGDEKRDAVDVQDKARAGEQEAKVTLAAWPQDAVIKARDQSATGRLTLNANIGDVIAVVAEYPGYDTVMREVTVDVPKKRVDLALKKTATPDSAMAKLTFNVTPAGALLFINGQQQPAVKSGVYELSGYKVGEDLNIEISAPKYETLKKQIRVSVAQYESTFNLKKATVIAQGPGEVRFDARPWARVSAGGKSCVTPCVLKLRGPKSYTATFVHAGQKKRKRFRIRPGRRVSVVHKF
ncbi:MAG: protein kinase, partial [Myxococcota bacterium]|nr:protein kinase [Myxococcota bacterium]